VGWLKANGKEEEEPERIDWTDVAIVDAIVADIVVVEIIGLVQYFVG